MREETQTQPKIDTTDVIRVSSTVSARAVADVEAELARAAADYVRALVEGMQLLIHAVKAGAQRGGGGM